MSLEALTDNIVQLCEECNVWSSTINIPHGNGDFLDMDPRLLHQRVQRFTLKNVPREDCTNRTIHLILPFIDRNCDVLPI
jgi:hypothetical protein